VTESSEEKIQQLQALEQNMQNFLMQRQQFQMQLVEVDSALDEIKNKDSVYRIIGNIMVSSNKEDVKNELEEKKKLLEIRVSNLEKQEQRLKEKADKLREGILHSLKENKQQ